MKLNIKLSLVVIFSFSFLFMGCNQSQSDLADEDYKKLFGDEKDDPPYFGYETMPKLPCEPNLSEEEYIYPGKEIKEKRKYTVTVKFYFKEKKIIEDNSESKSQVMLRFVDENKNLKILKTFKDYFDDNDSVDFKNGELYTRSFKAESGFPIYLGIFGAGYDIFEMESSIQAVSDDGLIVTPKIKYETKLYTDGFSPDFSYCEKIILP